MAVASFPALLHHHHHNPTSPRLSGLRPRAAFSDPFVLRLADALEDSLPAAPFLDQLRHSSSAALLSKPWPSRKDEPFRFTDVSFLKSADVVPATGTVRRPAGQSWDFRDEEMPSLVVVDGRVEGGLSDLAGVPAGVFVGSISDAPESVGRAVVGCVAGFADGDLFWDLNGVGAPDVAVVHVPAGVRAERPLRLVFASVEGEEEGSGRLPVSNPRCVVVVEKGGEIGIVEEFLGGDGGGECYWANSVVEVVVEEGATVRHAYWQRQTSSAAHIKWTFVRQVICMMMISLILVFPAF